jgi:hypothetical protein
MSRSWIRSNGIGGDEDSQVKLSNIVIIQLFADISQDVIVSEAISCTLCIGIAFSTNP